MKTSKELDCAVGLVDRNGQLPADVDYGEVLRILRHNGVPLLRIEKRGDSRCFRRFGEFERELAKEGEKHSLNREEYKAIKEVFLDKGIDSLLFKSVGTYPSFPYTSGNLDVLIRSESLEKARSLLRDLGYVELKNIEEPQKFLFKRFKGGRELLAVHLHTEVGWGVPFLDNSFVWGVDHRIPEDDFLVNLPSPEVSLLVALSHSLYENKAIRLHDLTSFDYLMGNSMNWNEMVAQARRRGWLDGFWFFLLLYDELEGEVFRGRRVPREVVAQASASLRCSLPSHYLSRVKRSAKVEMPFRVPFLLSKALFYKKVLADRGRDLRRRLGDLLTTTLRGLRVKLKIGSQRSMLIAVSGVDGAGKSLQVELLGKAFEQCGISTLCVWSRCGSTKFAGWFIRIGKTLFSGGRPPLGARGGPRGKVEARKRYLENPILRSGWNLLVLTELTILYNLRVRLPLLLGKVVICDRYLLDGLVELGVHMEDGDISRSVFARLLELLNPLPAMNWLIDVPAETVVRRKRMEPMEHLEAQVRLYRRLGKELHVVTVDGEQPADKVSDEIVYRTLTRYYDGFRTFLRGILFSNPSQLNP